MTIVCVAIISRDNTPLYLKSFSSQIEEIKFAYIVHSALDLLAEKCMLPLFFRFFLFFSPFFLILLLLSSSPFSS